ncbi:hypothetical protein PGTUg99_036522 [Puccinia graminis f. sp. tritici]|uniref:Secreted protein n=1 Tax=Puccinia graminis f. sp. tritici TaxID=56615 RepID=A0A5B0N414_PUCGR|nr:hypothetical protein PGTUg99_036522 [Puccinia graminis f. sp. tritici]
MMVSSRYFMLLVALVSCPYARLSESPQPNFLESKVSGESIQTCGINFYEEAPGSSYKLCTNSGFVNYRCPGNRCYGGNRTDRKPPALSAFFFTGCTREERLGVPGATGRTVNPIQFSANNAEKMLRVIGTELNGLSGPHSYLCYWHQNSDNNHKRPWCAGCTYYSGP